MHPFNLKNLLTNVSRFFFDQNLLTLDTLKEMKYIKDFDEYKIFELTDEEFFPVWEVFVKKMFDDASFMYNWRDLVSDSEKEKLKTLKRNIKSKINVHLGVYYENKMIGWSTGTQESNDRFYVIN